MNCVHRIILVAVATLLGSAPLRAQEQAFRVIVHADNPITTMSGAAVSQLFLKASTEWDDGRRVSPVDQSQETPVRQAFSERIHGRSATAIGAYWRRQVFSGGNIPPVERASDRDVIAFVAATPGAIGYVNASTSIQAGVHELRLGAASASAPTEDVVYTGVTADVQPQPLTAPRIRYPVQLRRRGIEGEVVVEFIVGLNGRPERASITIVSTSHEAFSNAAKELIFLSTFEPGQKKGRDVRVRVQQSVGFALHN